MCVCVCVCVCVYVCVLCVCYVFVSVIEDLKSHWDMFAHNECVCVCVCVCVYTVTKNRLHVEGHETCSRSTAHLSCVCIFADGF